MFLYFANCAGQKRIREYKLVGPIGQLNGNFSCVLLCAHQMSHFESPARRTPWVTSDAFQPKAEQNPSKGQFVCPSTVFLSNFSKVTLFVEPIFQNLTFG